MLSIILTLRWGYPDVSACPGNAGDSFITFSRVWFLSVLSYDKRMHPVASYGTIKHAGCRVWTPMYVGRLMARNST